MDDPWQESLRTQCAAAIDELAAFAGTGGQPGADGELHPEAGPRAVEPPSLYAFYEELLAVRNEMRHGNRKFAETFGRFGDVLDGMRQESGKLRERLARDSGDGAVSRGLALALVDICDRVDRLEAAAASQANNGWLARLKAEGRWQKQAEAIAFLRHHLQPVLAAAGVQRIPVQGQPFDPLWMKAVESPHQLPELEPADSSRPGRPLALVVEEELLPGYRMGDQCLRPAEVRLTTSPR